MSLIKKESEFFDTTKFFIQLVIYNDYFVTTKVTTISVWSFSILSSKVIFLSTSLYSSIKEPSSLNVLTSLLFGRTDTSLASWYVSTDSPYFIIIFNVLSNVKLHIKRRLCQHTQNFTIVCRLSYYNDVVLWVSLSISPTFYTFTIPLEILCLEYDNLKLNLQYLIKVKIIFDLNFYSI